MIIDKITNAILYFDLHPQLKKGLRFLLRDDLATLSVGKYEIDGENVFVLIQEYETIPPEQGRWESHYKYTDIQYMIDGEENMGYANFDEMKVVEQYEEKDLMFLEGEGDLFTVNQGAFAIFSPQDVHMPQIYLDGPKKIKKAVVKVLVD
ncbi:YhcH/YjgK/YiaL family protein [Metabacillus litoralis]|uniref:YhcH/YjgK/YiaL family protein n=1 Tax=Metabacillus litoralis TaxID=152268 RepID=UPI00203C6BD0|nr:YhcH/YjgK/YiaL family protein [Metabacillus litoralis]MCM3652946.1 YhcH/YjgK/YiaL family protein [Metabacillus litoralis]